MNARSYLFVPADRPDRLPKALASGADAVIVDLEDAVAPDAKSRARDMLANALPAHTAPWVRINPAGTPWYEDDVAFASEWPIAGVMLPKAESADELAALSRRVPGKPLMPLVETAHGLDRARTLAGVGGVLRLAFGSLDFRLDLGLGDGEEALVVYRSHLVWASRLAGSAPPVDGVTPDLDDDTVVRRDAANARTLGFGAKLCIHPRQVALVNAAFMPREEEIAWARRVVDAARRSAGAAVAVDGRMVDRPVIVRAQALLAQAGEALRDPSR